jgi:hypothetical protein
MAVVINPSPTPMYDQITPEMLCRCITPTVFFGINFYVQMTLSVIISRHSLRQLTEELEGVCDSGYFDPELIKNS